MSKLIIVLLALIMASCSKEQLPVKEVRVIIESDGTCHIDNQLSECATIGSQLVKANPKHEVSVLLSVHPDADYKVLASVMASIRSAKIERTTLDSSGSSE